MSVMNWLLDADPAIRWQVMRDLVHEPREVIAAERSRVAREGWGAQLLGDQAANGHWGGEAGRRTWMPTIYSLVMLKDLGVDPESEEILRAIARIQDNITWWQLDGRPFFDGETEPCINGGILATGAYFGVPSDRLAEHLLGEQLADGGWNCEAPTSQRASFHTTICVLEGLLAYEKVRGGATAITAARLRAHEYMMTRRMFRSLTSGEIIDRGWMRFSFPPTWHYDVLRGLDYLRSAGVPPDARIAESVAQVAKEVDADGRWPLHDLYPDRIPLDMEVGGGKASRWNTLRALRVLDWYGK